MKNKGFTLIELMIVIAIIAIIAAIAIPSLLRSTMSGNETAAIETLRQIQNSQATIRKQDNDKNLKNDYWVYDVFGIAAMENPANAGSPYEGMLDISVAQSDSRLAETNNAWTAPAGGPDYVITQNSAPKAGYYVDAIDVDASGNAYTINYNAANTTQIGNSSEYAFICYPDVYDKTGLNIYIVSTGPVYTVDAGGTDRRSGNGGTPDVYENGDTANWDKWPAIDPTSVAAPSGQNWRKSE